MSSIAFFGLGHMGLPMVLRLLKYGHEVHVCAHRDAAAPQTAARHGAVVEENFFKCAEHAEYIISILPDDRALQALFMNETMRRAVPEGSVIIEMTSCSPRMFLQLRQWYAEKGVPVLDAPVTGGVRGAREGTLKIIGGGDEKEFAAVSSILDVLASRVFIVSSRPGEGKLVKAMTNLLGAVNTAALGEFCRMALARGLDTEKLYEVGLVSSGFSTQFERRFRKMVSGDFSTNFALKLMRKDMETALAEAGDIPMPLAECAYGLYNMAKAFDNDDYSVIIRAVPQDGKS